MIISISAGIAAVWAQASKTKHLEKQLAAERAMATSTRGGKTGSAGSLSARDTRSPQERAERALAEFKKLSSASSEESDLLKVEREFMKVLPDFLQSLQGLGLEELLAVAGKLPEGHARNYVLHLAAEQDPQRIYEDESLTKGMANRDKLALLGRGDPAAALRELPPLKKLAPGQQGARTGALLGNPTLGARVHYATKLLGVDLEQGLDALREIHEANGRIPMGYMASMGIPSLPKGTIPGLVEAMENPEYAEMRGDLIEMTVTQCLFDGGVASVARLVESMELSPEEVHRAVDRAEFPGVMESEPGAMIDWMVEVRPTEVPEALVEWANRDQEAAVTWLEAQEPSPVRDQAIAQFARRASRLDREAAAAWAREIQDERLREQTLRRVGN